MFNTKAPDSNIIESLLANLNQKKLDLNDILSNKKGLSIIVESILNSIMSAQRDDFLLSNHDSKNGFYPRSLNTSLDKLDLSVPRTRTRNSDFFPPILQKYNRSDDSYFKLVANLLINGKSKENVKSILYDFNLHFSPKVANIIFDQISNELNDFKSAQLPSDFPFVYIDAYHTRIKDTRSDNDNSANPNGIVKDAAIYTVIGLDFDAKKRVLGFYVHFGHENKATWINIFNDLVQRGLKRVLMFISDDFSGISDAIHSVFPYSATQKCLVHFMRNCHKNLPANVAFDFIQQVKNIRDDSSLSFDEAVNKFENLCNSHKQANPTFIEYILKKKNEYWEFMNYDYRIRKYINNTNVVENFNSVIEKIKVNIGGYFQSVNVAEKSVYLIIKRLEKNVWNKPNPHLKGVEYDIQQKFNLTFGEN